MAANPTLPGSFDGIAGATNAVDITPHAANTFTPTRGITVLVSGTAAVRFANAAADVTVQLNAGEIYPYWIKAVRITGTTATGIVGLY